MIRIQHQIKLYLYLIYINVIKWHKTQQNISFNLNICEYNISVICPSPGDQDHCVETEAVMQAQNEEMMALVMEQYNNMSISMEEEKKAKLEQLYDQIVSFQESIDSAKATLETTTREAETEARVSPGAFKTYWSEASDSANDRGLYQISDKSLLNLFSH